MAGRGETSLSLIQATMSDGMTALIIIFVTSLGLIIPNVIVDDRLSDRSAQPKITGAAEHASAPTKRRSASKLGASDE